MSLTPSASTKFVYVESNEKIRYKSYEGQLRAKLLWPNFFEWDPTNYDELYAKIAKKFTTWIQEQGLDYFEIIERNNYTLRDMISLSLTLQPSEWRKDACRDINSLGGAKSETMVLVTISAVLWDDIIDSACHPGTVGYYELKQAVASVVEQIMNQDFKDSEALYQYLRSIGTCLLDPKYKTVLAVQQRLAENLRDEHKIKAKEYPYLAVQYRMIYDYLTLYSGNGLELLEDSQRQDYHRGYTVGCYLWPEIYCVLTKINLQPKIREDKYLKRLRYLGAQLTSVINDILSFEKEARYENPDNRIAHFVDGGMDLDTAINRAVNIYNGLVCEICELKEYLESGKHPTPTDSDANKAVQLALEFKEAIKLSYVMPATCFKAQIFCNRYNQRWYFD